MKKGILKVLIICLLFTLVSCRDNINSVTNDGGSMEEPVAAVNTKANEFCDMLDKEIPSLLKNYNVPGISVAVINDSQLEFVKGYGYADTRDKLPMNADTIFQVASISKPVAAWGIMKLVEEGNVNLDDPVEKYIKRWHFPKSGYDSKGVTIRRLLNHTAGLSVTGYPGVDPSIKIPTLEDSLEGYEPHVESLSIIYEPGTKWKYSGGGYTLLQLLIEETTGESFENYMQTEVLQPLDMYDSTYNFRKVDKKRLSKAYDTKGDVVPNYLFSEKAAAGLYTTATDLAKFVTASFVGTNNESPGRDILSSASLELMFQSTKESDGTWGLGYKVGLNELNANEKVVSHSGSNFGWKVVFVEKPASRDGIVVLTNSDNGADLMMKLVKKWESCY